MSGILLIGSKFESQARAFAADVADLNSELVWQLALYVETVLHRASSFEILIEVIDVGAVQLAHRLIIRIGLRY